MTTTSPARVAATDVRKDAERIAYVVLGMHRSGTSAVTQVLALAGAELPENVMAGDEHNARGYFEPWKIAMFNDERLRAAGSAWDDVFVHLHAPLARRDERVWLNRAMALFEDEYGLSRRPLLKDPRVSVLLPFWRTVLADLGGAMRCVIPVRHPLAVAGSLGRRNGFPPQKSVLLWTAYMLASEAGSGDLPRAFVSYDALLADWRSQVARIEAAHGAALPNLDRRADREISRFLTPELRHNAEAGDLEALGWTGRLARQVHDWFEAAAADEAPDRAPLIAAAEELKTRQAEIGALISPMASELDAVRTELLHVRQHMEFHRAEAARLRAKHQELKAACDAASASLDAALNAS